MLEFMPFTQGKIGVISGPEREGLDSRLERFLNSLVDSGHKKNNNVLVVKNPIGDENSENIGRHKVDKVTDEVDEISNLISDTTKILIVAGAAHYDNSFLDLAEAIVKGKAEITTCAPGGQEVYNKIAEILGVETKIKKKKIARVRCNGGKRSLDKYEYRGLKKCAGANLLAGGSKACRFGCLGFGDCVDVCPFDSIRLNENNIPVVNGSKCTACGKCVEACPKKIIVLENADEKIYVKCLSQDKGAVVKSICPVGCIGCKICEKISGGIFIVANNLSRADYSKVKSIQLIPIIESKDYGRFPAVEICKKMGINSLSQHEKLQEATQEIYKIGFHTGVMIDTCGRFAGMKVIEAKDAMKAELIKNKKADIMYETSRPAKSRDGGEVIVAVLDNQWFIDFNAKGWKKEAGECLNSMSIVPEKFRKQFEDTFAWLDKRPCARKRGLGTKLPYDREWVIESLSDSTLYMTLYTIANKVNEYKLTEGQLTPEFFDYVYLEKGGLEKVSAKLNIPEAQLKALREAFGYWYPNDHRHTFTAHLSNHLSFMIFAHTACLPKEKWPKKITFHGMVISEGTKMSKSKGNVVTLLDINNRYGADTFRAFLCNSTSIDSTLNWESDEVEKMKTHISSLFDMCNEICTNRKKAKLGNKFAAFASRFENDVKKAGAFLAAMNLRDYSNIVLHDIPRIYRKARRISEQDIPTLNDYVAERYVKMLCPLVPHYAEELWAMAGKGFVSNAEWPQHDEKKINPMAEFSEDSLEALSSDIRKVLELAKIEKPKKITLFTAGQWKYELVGHVKKLNTRNAGEIIKSVMQTQLKQHGQDIMKLVPKLAEKTPEFVLEKKDEEKALKDSVAALEQEFNCKIEIIDAEKSQAPKARQAMPGKPAILAE